MQNAQVFLNINEIELCITNWDLIIEVRRRY